MSLAEKVNLIRQEQERTKEQFRAELFQGLQQVDAFKQKEEIEAKRIFERQQEIDRTTITGTEEIKTDLGATKTTTFGSGRERIDTLTDTTTPKTGFEEIKSGNEIITIQNGKEIARSPRWKPEQTEGSKRKIRSILKLEDEIRDLETKVAGYRQEVASARPEEVEGSERKGIMQGTKFFPVEQILRDINSAQGQIRKKGEQVEKLSAKIDKKIGKKKDSGGYKSGEVVDGYEYLGGDYTDKKNWKKVE